MSKLFFISLLISFFTCTQMHAQESKNTVYIEGFGSSITVTSINYDRIFYSRKNFWISNRFGLGGDALNLFENYNPFSLTEMVNISLGKRNSHLEYGTGITYNIDAGASSYTYNGVTTLTPYKETRVILVLGISYKYQRPSGGLFFRIGVTPNFLLYPKREPCSPNSLGCLQDIDLLLHFLGASVGYSF